ncbi:DMT family transporter [Flexivirga meconopsidis]|uniref:DMT family transporter n=1 Tax=Flexivirga meconopsidis TaxID=2977121 RepID=UPI00223ED6F8|nr:DMT family transporter [Flexivirga meconopsidis]
MSKPIGIFMRQKVALPTAFVLAWSSGFVIAHLGVGTASLLTFLTWRYLIASALLWAVPSWRPTRMPAVDLARDLRAGLLTQLGYIVPVYAAIGVGVSTGAASLIDALQPVIVATLAGPLLGLSVTRTQWSGLVAALVGVTMIVWSNLGASTAPWWGYLVAGVAISSQLAGVLLDRGRHDRQVLPTLTVHVTATTAVLVVVAAITGGLVPPRDPAFWCLTLASTLVPTVAAYALYWGVARVFDVTVLGYLLFLVTPTTTIAGAILFDEPLTATIGAGILLSFLGVAITLSAGKHKGGPPAPGCRRTAFSYDGSPDQASSSPSSATS